MSAGAEGQSGKVFPRPDRSSFQPRLDRTDEIYEFDVGWTEGCLSDRRPYRAELWTWRDLLAVTFYFSTIGLETASPEELLDLLRKDNLLLSVDHKSPAAEIVPDASGNKMWSLSVILLRGREAEARAEIHFRPYTGCPPLEKINLAGGLLISLVKE